MLFGVRRLAAAFSERLASSGGLPFDLKSGGKPPHSKCACQHHSPRDEYARHVAKLDCGLAV